MTDPAALYENWFVPAVFAPMARRLLDRTEVSPGARVLDVACGSGIVARSVARRVKSSGRVVGLDMNQAMLDVARARSAEEGLAIEWREGSAQELPFVNGTFDLVLCQHGLQFFPDKPRALAEMHRVLAPGGWVAIATWRKLDQNPFFAAYEQAARRHLSTSAIEIPFSLGDPVVLAELLRDADFHDVSVEPADIEADYAQPERFIEFQTIASAAAIPSLRGMAERERDALIAAIREDLAETVREATVNGRVRFPMKGIVARGMRR